MAHDQELHDHDRGLSHDLSTLLSRRRALTLLGGAGLAAALAGCGITGSEGSTGGSPTASSAAGAASAGTGIPEETAGPYPGDGSNGVDVLSESGIVRSDITRSFGSGSAVAQGVPLTVKLKVLDTGNGSTGLRGAAVYLWHCDRDGRYSLYSEGITQENYLRGVQEAADDGSVRFTTIYPGAYSGRWPHIHFEVYPSLDAATTASGKLRTSQLALPEAACKLVYATEGYGQSLQNLAQTSLDTDMVFSDGYSLQLATVTGTVADGMTATLNVPV
jgi:protocatechuate 3,4-dioxygenase beta subunit